MDLCRQTFLETLRFGIDSGLRCLINSLSKNCFNPLNAKLNPICHLLELLGAHHILHVSRIRVNIRLKVTTDGAAFSGNHEKYRKTMNSLGFWWWQQIVV
jgi:hypothetical protein